MTKDVQLALERYRKRKVRILRIKKQMEALQDHHYVVTKNDFGLVDFETITLDSLVGLVEKVTKLLSKKGKKK
jgi:hypothetical protein